MASKTIIGSDGDIKGIKQDLSISAQESHLHVNDLPLGAAMVVAESAPVLSEIDYENTGGGTATTKHASERVPLLRHRRNAYANSNFSSSSASSSSPSFPSPHYEELGNGYDGDAQNHNGGGSGSTGSKKATPLRQSSYNDTKQAKSSDYFSSQELNMMENEQFLMNIQSKVARKYEMYHSIVFNFFVFVMLIQFAMMAGALFYEGFEKKLDGKRIFLLAIVTPIYFITASMVFVTRKHYMLNNAATHAFSGVGGYMLAFVSFIFFSEFNNSLTTATS
jgi:hypothetical protein